eukprot:5499454-Pyramimonas_sp.AAC.1
MPDGSQQKFATVDTHGYPTDIYASADKRPATVRTEIVGNQIRQQLIPLYLSSRFYTDKHSGTIACKRKQLIRVVIHNPLQPPTPQFCVRNMSFLGFDLAQIRKSLQHATSPPQDLSLIHISEPTRPEPI